MARGHAWIRQNTSKWNFGTDDNPDLTASISQKMKIWSCCGRNPTMHRIPTLRKTFSGFQWIFIRPHTIDGLGVMGSESWQGLLKFCSGQNWACGVTCPFDYNSEWHLRKPSIPTLQITCSAFWCILTWPARSSRVKAIATPKQRESADFSWNWKEISVLE
jgi:hypothetical protein